MSNDVRYRAGKFYRELEQSAQPKKSRARDSVKMLLKKPQDFVITLMTKYLPGTTRYKLAAQSMEEFGTPLQLDYVTVLEISLKGTEKTMTFEQWDNSLMIKAFTGCIWNRCIFDSIEEAQKMLGTFTTTIDIQRYQVIDAVTEAEFNAKFDANCNWVTKEFCKKSQVLKELEAKELYEPMRLVSKMVVHSHGSESDLILRERVLELLPQGIALRAPSYIYSHAYYTESFLQELGCTPEAIARERAKGQLFDSLV